MSFVVDVDVLLLYAVALAGKRRPAEPVEIVAAIDLVQGNIPSEEKLVDAFGRLGVGGLLMSAGDGVALSVAAEKLIEGLPRKGEHAERLFELRGLLAAFRPAAAGAALVFDADQLRAAILAHRAAAASGGKQMLVPKPKPEAGKARPGQRRRKPLPKSRKR